MILSFFPRVSNSHKSIVGGSTDQLLARDLAAWLKGVITCCTCVTCRRLCFPNHPALICNRHYTKKVNRLYVICVNLCTGLLKWIVSFQFSDCDPWYRERMNPTQILDATILRVPFYANDFRFSLDFIQSYSVVRIFYC